MQSVVSQRTRYRTLCGIYLLIILALYLSSLFKDSICNLTSLPNYYHNPLNIFLIWYDICLIRRNKKKGNPKIFMTWRFPFFILRYFSLFLAPKKNSDYALAGLLTSGLFYSPRLPILILCRLHNNEQWHLAVFVPGYSGGSAPDFNGFPFSLHHLENLYILMYYIFNI